jgi:hypothetical protein
VLDPRKPLADIDPADAKVGKLDILAGELRIFLNHKLVRIYHQVHCYEIDVDSRVAELRSETKLKQIPLAKPTSPADLEAFTKNYSGRRTVEEFWAAAQETGYVTRERAEAALKTLGPRPRGRRAKNWRPTPWSK